MSHFLAQGHQGVPSCNRWGWSTNHIGQGVPDDPWVLRAAYQSCSRGIYHSWLQIPRSWVFACDSSSSPSSAPQTPVIPTTTDTDRYFRNDLVQHDTRYLEREVHVMLSPSMKSLPKDIQMDYIKEYSLAGDNSKILEHPVRVKRERG